MREYAFKCTCGHLTVKSFPKLDAATEASIVCERIVEHGVILIDGKERCAGHTVYTGRHGEI